jgi:hypothetical protein
MFEPQQKTSSPKILVKIGVSHAAGRKSESDYLKLHNKLLLRSNPREARYELKVVEASA